MTDYCSSSGIENLKYGFLIPDVLIIHTNTNDKDPMLSIAQHKVLNIYETPFVLVVEEFSDKGLICKILKSRYPKEWIEEKLLVHLRNKYKTVTHSINEEDGVLGKLTFGPSDTLFIAMKWLY